LKRLGDYVVSNDGQYAIYAVSQWLEEKG